MKHSRVILKVLGLVSVFVIGSIALFQIYLYLYFRYFWNPSVDRIILPLKQLVNSLCESPN